MPLRPEDLRTGGALQGAVAASLLQQREQAAALAQGAAVGAFRVLRELGRGGMAIVYLAERADGEYQQQVALKWMLQAQPDAASAQLFRRERQALADLRHPHIARLLDGGRTEEGRPWFAMEYIEGAPLDRHCVAGGLPRAARLRLFLQVCAAVAFAHARGVIHRDIKPSNVLVDADGSAKLLDFGIAQLLGSDDAAATRAYTPGFASPEQLRAETLTVASDVYQLGRLLAALLSGDEAEQATLQANATVRGAAVRRAAGASNAASLGSQSPEAGELLQTRDQTAATTPGRASPREDHVNPARDDASTAHARLSSAMLPRQLPADLTAVLRRACADRPAERYATAQALAEDVRAVLERRPVQARPRRFLYVATRFVQRHPFGASAVLAVLALAAASSAAFTQRLQRERDAATYQANAATAVIDFLNQDLLDAANPQHRPPDAPDMTVREALRVAEGNVERRFALQPEIAAGVLSTLAEVHYQFGEMDQALALLDRAQAWPGFRADSREGLRVRAKRGTLYTTLNRFDEAEVLQRAVVRDAKRILGPNDRDTLEYELRLIENAERRTPDMSQAPRFADLRRRADTALGVPNSISGEADYLIGDDARMLGTPLRAATQARRALATLTAVQGPHHPATLKAQTTVAFVQLAEGDTEAALQSLRDAHASYVARYGPDVLDALFMQNELGLQLIFAEHLEQARHVFEDLLERRGRVQGETSSQLLPALSNLGNVHLREGHADLALLQFDRAAGIAAADPKTPPYVLSSVNRGRADALRELGRLDEAKSALDAGDAAAASLAPDDLRRLTLRGARARLHIAQGRIEDGRQELEATIEALRAQGVQDMHPYLKPLLLARAAL